MIYLVILVALFQPAPTAATDAPHGTLTFNIVDNEGKNIPARLTFTDDSGDKHDMFPNADANPTKLAVRWHAVYTLDGTGTITVPVGSWS